MKNWALKHKDGRLLHDIASDGSLAKDITFFDNRETVRNVRAGLEKPEQWHITRGPDNSYVKASPDVGRHPKKGKSKNKFAVR